MEGLLPAVLILACPIGMGLMMWMMAKGTPGAREARLDDGRPDAPSLSELRVEHERLGAEIARLSPAPCATEPERRGEGDPEPTGRRAG